MVETVMYIFVNKDLKMTSGKVAGQVGHGVGMIYENLHIQSMHIKESFLKWQSEARAKIVLKASLEEMLEIMNSFRGELIQDLGRTQIDPGSYTVLCLYPKNKDNTFANFKLY